MSRNAFNDLEREYNRRQDCLDMEWEQRMERKSPFRCADGFCGADDCARCRPNTYWMEDTDDTETSA